MSADVTTDLVKESCHHLRGTTEFSALQIQRGMVWQVLCLWWTGTLECWSLLSTPLPTFLESSSSGLERSVNYQILILTSYSYGYDKVEGERGGGFSWKIDFVNLVNRGANLILESRSVRVVVLGPIEIMSVLKRCLTPLLIALT